MAAVAAAAAAAAASGLAALRQANAACPSAELQASAARRLAAVDQLVSNAPSLDELQSLPTEAAAEMRSQLLPLIRRLAGLLQRADTEVTSRAAVAPRSPRPSGSAQLYLSILAAMRSLAGVPALAAVLDDEEPPSKGPTTVHSCLEVLLAQTLLVAAPTNGLAGLLALCSSHGTSLLVSTTLREDARSMQASANMLLGGALEFFAAQIPLLWRQLAAQELAAPLNSLVSSLLGRPNTSAAWGRMWAPVQHGLRALLTELVTAGGPQLYAAFQAGLPPYDSGNRPPLLSRMNAEYSAAQNRHKAPNGEQLLERRLERILLQCGFKATEQAGLAALRDFIAVHGAFVSLFLAQSQGTPYGSLVANIVAAATGSHGVPTAQPAMAVGHVLVPLNRQIAGQAPAAGCAAAPAEGCNQPGGFISRLRPPTRQ